MKKGYAHVTFVLDNSGSMQSLKPATIEGYNNFLRKQKALPGTLTTSLYQFTDHNPNRMITPAQGVFTQQANAIYGQNFPGIPTINPVQSVQVPNNIPETGAPLTVKTTYRFVDVSKMDELNNDNYNCNTMTPLIDAMAWAIEDTGNYLAALKEEDRPESVTVVVLTDGNENHSYRYSKEQLVGMTKRQTDEYNWDFVYLGANQDAIQVGQSYGFSAAASMNYVATSASTTASYNAVSDAVGLKRSLGAKSKVAFSDAVRATVVSGDNGNNNG